MRPESVQAGRQAGRLYMRSRGPRNAGEVPLQRGVVLHNVSTAAGDDASHHHAWDETPTLRSGPRGTAGIDNGDARPACTYKRTPGQHMLARILTDTQRSCLFFFFFQTRTDTKNTRIHGARTLRIKRHRSLPEKLTQQYVGEGEKK